MDINRIKQYLDSDISKVKALITNILKSDVTLLNTTNDSIVSNSGKMLRPMLALLIARVLGKVNEDTLRFAAAAELLHNATLLHDDVADNSPSRRGSPTVMSYLGSGAAVLLGDYWLVKAVKLILQADRNETVALRIFSKTLEDLAEGEMLQLEKADKMDIDEEAYYRVVYCKTASLFEAAATTAAISIQSEDAIVEAVRTYAINLGIAFQIKDDIFDYQEDASSIGKPVGNDLKEGKITLPLLGAFRNIDKNIEDDYRHKISRIHEYPGLQEDISRLVREKNGLEYAYAKMDEFIVKALDSIMQFPDNQAKTYLVELAEFVKERKV